MILLRPFVLGVVALAAFAVPASAQTWVNQNWSENEQNSAASITAQLNRQAGFNVAAGREFGPAIEFASDYQPEEARNPFAETTTRDVWREGDGFSDRLRLRARGELRRADGSPVPPTPLDAAMFDPDGYEVSYTRGWDMARGYTENGLEVTLTPHVGIGAGDRGGTAEAGATLKIGSSADRILPQFQAIRVGDWVPMAATVNETTAFKVTAFEANRWLLWAKPNSTWAWQLTPIDGEIDDPVPLQRLPHGAGS